MVNDGNSVARKLSFSVEDGTDSIGKQVDINESICSEVKVF